MTGGTEAPYSPYGVHLEPGGGDVGELDAVAEGLATVQDEGSQLVALALTRAPLLGADSGRWLDLCAGPGGKSVLLGALPRIDGGHLDAVEHSEHRADLVRRATDGLPVDRAHRRRPGRPAARRRLRPGARGRALHRARCAAAAPGGPLAAAPRRRRRAGEAAARAADRGAAALGRGVHQASPLVAAFCRPDRCRRARAIAAGRARVPAVRRRRPMPRPDRDLAGARSRRAPGRHRAGRPAPRAAAGRKRPRASSPAPPGRAWPSPPRPPRRPRAAGPRRQARPGGGPSPRASRPEVSCRSTSGPRSGTAGMTAVRTDSGSPGLLPDAARPTRPGLPGRWDTTTMGPRPGPPRSSSRPASAR